jgi:transposase-like protein
VINTNKAPTNCAPLVALKEEGTYPPTTGHRQVKYWNNIVEADHGKLKRLINPTLSFQSLRTAYATIKGFEVMPIFRPGMRPGMVRPRGIAGGEAPDGMEEELSEMEIPVEGEAPELQ